jgi:hypothetical protein
MNGTTLSVNGTFGRISEYINGMVMINCKFMMNGCRMYNEWYVEWINAPAPVNQWSNFTYVTKQGFHLVGLRFLGQG